MCKYELWKWSFSAPLWSIIDCCFSMSFYQLFVLERGWVGVTPTFCILYIEKSLFWLNKWYEWIHNIPFVIVNKKIKRVTDIFPYLHFYFIFTLVHWVSFIKRDRSSLVLPSLICLNLFDGFPLAKVCETSLYASIWH